MELSDPAGFDWTIAYGPDLSYDHPTYYITWFFGFKGKI